MSDSVVSAGPGTRLDAILSKLRDIAAGLLEVDPAEVDLDRHFLEMGADSLALMDASRAIQETFGLTVSIRMLLEEIATLANLASYIDQALSKTESAPSGSPHGVEAAPSPPPAKGILQTPVAMASPSSSVEEPRPLDAPAQSLPLPQVPRSPEGVESGHAPPTPASPMAMDPDQLPQRSPVVHEMLPPTSILEHLMLQQVQLMAQQVDSQRQILAHQLTVLQDHRAATGALPPTHRSPSDAPPLVRDSKSHTTGPAVEVPFVRTGSPLGEAVSQIAISRPTATPSADLHTPQAEAAKPPSRVAAVQGSPAGGSAAAPARPSVEQFVPYRPITPGSGISFTPQQRSHVEALVGRYTRRTAGSKRAAQRYRPVFAENRASAGFQVATKEMLYPIVATRSRGSRFWDVDDNEYIDLTMGFGSLLFGHQPGFVTEAIAEQLNVGMQIGPQSHQAGEVAELIAELTGMERVALCNTGTEAVMAALRLARTATGRARIVVFAGAFHGSYDCTLARGRTIDGVRRSIPMAPGIPRSMVEDILVLDYGTPESLEAIRAHGRDLAGVLVEPVQSRRPDFQPKEFLTELRKITLTTNTPLIFDEIITGFRVHPRGAQGWFGVAADLATYGKVIGGGMPIGVVAGNAKLMDGFDGGQWTYGDDSFPRALTSFFAGTFSKHPLTMAASRAVLMELKRQGPILQDTVNARTTRLADRLNVVFVDEDVPIRIVHFGSLFRFVLPAEAELLFAHLVEKGVYIWEGRNCFLSTAHSDEDIDIFVRAVRESVQELRRGGFLPERGSHSQKMSGGLSSGVAETASRVQEPVRSQEPVSGPHAAQGRSARPRVEKAIDFSLYYFGKYDAPFRADKYDLLFDGAKFADQHGFSAVWFPERHFHAFGGLSPNPSVLAAALARETEHVRLRAGSVILPLHHPIRVAEEWSVVDNLSKGRVGISFGSGWHPNDFVFAPEAFGTHRERMFQGLEMVRRLWRGEAIEVPGGDGRSVTVTLFPQPMQPELPTWVTIVNNAQTYVQAGEIGAGVLTNLMDQKLEDLARNIELYRTSLANHGHAPSVGHVTVLLHTFVGPDADRAREIARKPFCDYLRSFLGLTRSLLKSQGISVDFDRVSEEDMEYVLSLSFDRYVQTTALIGTPDSCGAIVDKLATIGVDEIACFIDFGIARSAVLDSLPHLNELRARYAIRDLSLPATPAAIATEATIAQVGGNGDGAHLAAPEHTEAPEDGQGTFVVPLTEGQQGFWLFSQLSDEAASASTESLVLRLEGSFHMTLLQGALRQLVDRHEALRTTIDGSGEFQRIWPSVPVDIELIDFSSLEPSARDDAANQWLTEQKEPTFDLVRGPLWRCMLLRLSETEHLLVLTVHHLVIDGVSLTVVGYEMAAIYDAASKQVSPKLPPPLQFQEYAKWEEAQRHSPARAASEAYWAGQFADMVPFVDLPADRPRPPRVTYRGAREHARVDTSLHEALKRLSRQWNSTLFMTMFGAFTVFLHRLTGLDDLVVGMPSARRTLPGSENLVGFTLNFLPLRIRLKSDATFPQHLATIRRTLLDSYEHDACPVGTIARNLNLPRDPSRPLFVTTAFNLNPRVSMPKMGELTVDLIPRPISFTPFEFFLDAMEVKRGSGMELRLDFFYSTALFDRETMRRWMQHFTTLLERLVANPEHPIASYSLLTDTEREELLIGWNATQAPPPESALLHERVEAQVRRTPEAVAVVYGDDELTYQELDRQANQVAHYLHTLGVGPEVLVGLCMDRSLEIVVALLGILKAGGAYVPLDPRYPKDRLGAILEEAQVSLVLTDGESATSLPPHGAKVVNLEMDAERIARESVETPSSTGCPDNLIYVIFTSGSTGKPKGVMATHRGLCNRITWMQEAYPLTVADRVLQKTPISFDVSAWEFFWPLVAGARLVMARPKGHQDPAYLAGVIAAAGITTMHFVPSMLQSFLDLPGVAACTSLRQVFCSGEELPNELCERFFAHLSTSGVNLHNLYGPTEASIDVTAWTCRAGWPRRRVPIGRPIANTQIYILDSLLQPCPIGVPGELCIGGVGVARGYLQQPGLTAESFIPHPFSDEGARLYKTGDRARYLPDGNIEFLGRTDHQVKIRGFRIELGEIEAALSQYAAVREAVVVAREDAPGEKRLVAYLVPKDTQGIPVDALRAFVKTKLPDHMVPNAFIELPILPLTPSGKVDRRGLPAPGHARPALERTYVEPRTMTEKAIASIWTEVLGIERVGIHDDFFDLGGHSLQGTRVITRIRSVFRVELTLNQLFETPTVAGLTAAVVQCQIEQADNNLVSQVLAEVEQLSSSEAERVLVEQGETSGRPE